MDVLPDPLEKPIKEVPFIGRPGLQAAVEIRETGTRVATPDRMMSRFYGNTYSDTVFCFADTVVLLYRHSDFATKTHHFPAPNIVSTTNVYTGSS